MEELSPLISACGSVLQQPATASTCWMSTANPPALCDVGTAIIAYRLFRVSSSVVLLPNAYAKPPPTKFAKHKPIVAPRITPLVPNQDTKGFRRLLARTRYVPLRAAVVPALSILNPWRLRYVEKSNSGGKSIGSVWNGRACWAKTNVPRRAGGIGFSARKSMSE